MCRTTRKAGDDMKKRKKVHDEYVFVKAYQKLFDYSDKQMGDMLGCSASTYSDKVRGWLDFGSLEGKELSRIFNVSQDFLFLTKKGVERHKTLIFTQSINSKGR
jgi:hypothetical protein